MANQGFWQNEGTLLSADNLNAMLLQYGSVTGRPAYGQRGRQWFDTATGIEYYDTGTSWEVKQDNSINMIRFRNTSSAITASLSSPVIITCNNVNSSGAMVRASSGELHLLVTENVAANADGHGWLRGIIKGLTVPSTLNDGDSVWIRSSALSTIGANAVYAGKLLNKTSKLVLYDYNKSIQGNFTGIRDYGKDFNTLSGAGNSRPTGIWSDGTTMWVADFDDDKIYAYNLSTKARDSSKDFNTLSAAGNTDPVGIWSDGTTMWVADNGDDKLFAYNLSTKARDSGKDFNTLNGAGNNNPNGIWSNGTTMWASDTDDDKLFAYNMSTKARDSGKDFNTLSAAGNNVPTSIWSDGTIMWVSDTDAKIYAYNLSTKARDSSKDFNTLSAAGNTQPYGMWSDGTTMWVSDYLDSEIYAYNFHSGTIS